MLRDQDVLRLLRFELSRCYEIRMVWTLEGLDPRGFGLNRHCEIRMVHEVGIEHGGSEVGIEHGVLRLGWFGTSEIRMVWDSRGSD
jgi:hypothetical protein